MERRNKPSSWMSLRLQPRLEHQNVPEQVVPVARTVLVFRPFLCDRPRIEVAFAFEPRLVEQRGCPLLEGATQPVIDRNAESHLGTLDQRLRQVSAQEL